MIQRLRNIKVLLIALSSFFFAIYLFFRKPVGLRMDKVLIGGSILSIMGPAPCQNVRLLLCFVFL